MAVIPCERINFTRLSISGLFVTSMPPSPVEIFLLEKKLKHPTSPIVPNFFP
jgi:hypothetical protein